MNDQNVLTLCKPPQVDAGTAIVLDWNDSPAWGLVGLCCTETGGSNRRAGKNGGCCGQHHPGTLVENTEDAFLGIHYVFQPLICCNRHPFLALLAGHEKIQRDSVFFCITDTRAENPFDQHPASGRNHCGRMESQVERTLELARLEGGGPVFTQTFSIKSCLDRSLQDWCEMHKKRLEIKTAIQDSLVHADSHALHIILKNLLENSLRHSKKEKVQVNLNLEKKPGWIILHYRDNGVGVQDQVKNLGKLFHKGQGSQGAGVGLYLVCSLIRQMGGRVEFHPSENGFATSLWFKEGFEDV